MFCSVGSTKYTYSDTNLTKHGHACGMPTFNDFVQGSAGTSATGSLSLLMFKCRVTFAITEAFEAVGKGAGEPQAIRLKWRP